MSYFITPQTFPADAPRGRGRNFAPSLNSNVISHEQNIPQPHQARQQARVMEEQLRHPTSANLHSSPAHAYPEHVSAVPAHHLPSAGGGGAEPHDASWLGKLSAGGEVPAKDMQRKHPNIAKHSQSSVFMGPQQDRAPPNRIHYHSEEALRSLMPTEEDRKEKAVHAMMQYAEGGPVARMTGNDVPWRASQAEPVDKGPHRNMHRNKSMIGIGGFQASEPTAAPIHSGRKKGCEDYEEYVQAPLAPRRYVKIDGKTTDTAMIDAPPVVNPLTGQGLMCNDYVMSGATANPYGNRPAVTRQQLAEPPHRKPAFEHGRPVLY